MVLSPLGQRVLLKRILISKRGSLFIPEGSREMRHNLGEVMAVGPDCTAVSAGDLVMFGKYAAVNLDRTEVEDAGVAPIPQDEEWLVMNEEDFICIVVKDEPKLEVAHA